MELPDDYLTGEVIRYYSRTGTDFVISETLQGYLGSVIVSMRLAREGLDPQRIAYLSSRPDVRAHRITTGDGEGEGSEQEITTTLFTAIAFTLLLSMTVLLYGQATGRSVLNEKTSKTVEIMLSTVRPGDMLFGKLLGQVFAALTQYALWVGVGFVLIRFIGPSVGFSLPAALTTATFGYLVLFFLLAFFLYSAAYAAIASGAEDDTHLSQLGWPLIAFLVLPLMLASAFIMNPDSTLGIVLSYFRFTAPIVMFIRALVDTPPAWEILRWVRY